MTIEEINTICYVGAGTMGCFNSMAAAISGYHVVLYDTDENTLQQVPQRHREMAALLVGGGYCSEKDIAGALQRVSLTSDLLEATSNADLVSESVFERLEVKRDIHRKLDMICPPHTILTTNTSALQVSDIEDVVDRGDRFAALHSHLGSPLVDIVAGPRTDLAIVDILQRYVLSTKGVPLVLKKEHPGYVLNAMLGPLLRTALLLTLDGVASRDQVDSAWMSHRNDTTGPFGKMDLFGLNLILDSWLYGKGDLYRQSLRPRILELLQPYVDRGDLGIKSGRGFYSYPNPVYQQPGFLEVDSDLTAVQQALDTALVGNAVLLAAMEVADTTDIDRAWMVGTSVDIGPFGILAEMGRPAFLQLLAAETEAGRFSSPNARMVEAYLQRPVGKVTV